MLVFPKNAEKNASTIEKGLINSCLSHNLQIRTWGPFLERPDNLTGPKSYFEIKFSRKVGCALTSNEVHFVSLADNFTVQFSNLLKLLSTIYYYRELRERAPDPFRFEIRQCKLL